MTKSRTALVLSLAAAALGLGGLAYASVGSDTGPIVACYQNDSGQLRVVTPTGKDCNANSETALSWNRQGPAGPPGANGTDGTNGVSGYQVVSRTGSVAAPPANGAIGVSVSCPAGKQPLGGGGSGVEDSLGVAEMVASFPLTAGSGGWIVAFGNTDASIPTGTTLSYSLWVVCAAVS